MGVLPSWSSGQDFTANAGDAGSIPGQGAKFPTYLLAEKKKKKNINSKKNVNKSICTAKGTINKKTTQNGRKHLQHTDSSCT